VDEFNETPKDFKIGSRKGEAGGEVDGGEYEDGEAKVDRMPIPPRL